MLNYESQCRVSQSALNQWLGNRPATQKAMSSYLIPAKLLLSEP